jgi:hypothetical protein
MKATKSDGGTGIPSTSLAALTGEQAEDLLALLDIETLLNRHMRMPDSQAIENLASRSSELVL